MPEKTLIPVDDALLPATMRYSKVYNVPYAVVGKFTEPRLECVRGENFLLGNYYCQKPDYPHLSLAVDISHFFDLHDIQDWSGDRSFNRPRTILSLARRASFRLYSQFEFIMFREKETKDYLYDTIFAGLSSLLEAYGKKYSQPRYEWWKDNFDDEFTSYIVMLGSEKRKSWPRTNDASFYGCGYGIFMTHAVRIQRGL